MKKFLFLKIQIIALFTAFLLTSFGLPSYVTGNFSQFYNKGLEFYKLGNYEQAVKEFEKAVELNPDDVHALYGLGNTYYCWEEYDDAVKIYTKAINVNPDYANVYYSLSLAYSKLGMSLEAEKQGAIFRKLSQGGSGSLQKISKPHSVVSSSPGTGKFGQSYNICIELYKKGRYDQAEKEFKKSLKLKPDNIYALYGLGNTYYCKAKYDAAVKVYTKAININPDYAKVHYSLSLAYSKLGITLEAEKQRAIFRKLSQGEGTTQKHAKPHADIDHS